MSLSVELLYLKLTCCVVKYDGIVRKCISCWDIYICTACGVFGIKRNGNENCIVSVTLSLKFVILCKGFLVS